MKIPRTKQKHGRQGSAGNWRWIAMLAVLACLMTGSATAGTLTVTSIPIVSANKVYLGAEGDLDWGQWGTFATGNFNHKAGVVSQISDLSLIGSGVLNSFAGAAANAVWFDGTLDKIVIGRATGAYVNGPAGNGFQLTIPASVTTKVLNLYIGVFNVQGQLDLALSDETTFSLTNNGNRRFTITFADSTASATLTVNYYNLAAGGNVTLMAASLATATSLPLSVAAPQLSGPSSVKAGSTFDLLANPLGVLADGTTAFAYQWRVDGADLPGATNNPYNGATAGSVGVHSFQVVITNNVLGTAVTSAPVVLTVTAPTGTLSVSAADLPPAGPPTFTPLDINLTTEGVIDWAHWGTTGPGDYDTRANIIGNFTQIGTDAANQFDSTVTYTWTDATTANTAMPAWNVGIGLPVANGFLLNIPASSTSNRLVNIYVGVGVGASLHFVASMSDGSSPLFTEDDAITSGTRRYTIVYQAATPGSTLNVSITMPQRNAGGGLQRISLQSATLLPVPPLSVSPLVVDPGTAVLVNQPMVVSVAPLDPQGAPPFSYVWQRDTGAGYVNLPDTGKSASFVAGSTVGSESCRVIVTGSQGSITSAPVVLTRSLATGLLKILSKEPITGLKNLTLEGSIDWSHWGNGGVPGFDQKITGGSAIGNYIIFGPGTISGPFGSSSYNWTDGTPNLALTNSQGVYHNGPGNGFELDVAATTTNRVLHVYLGSFQCVAHIEAYLSDNSALKVIDETIPNGQARQVNIEFAAGSAGQTLIFRFWDSQSTGGNVTLMAASLEGVPPLAVGTPTIGPTNTVAVGSSIYLDAQGANGLAPLKYQWQLNSGSGYVAMPGATNAHVATSASAIGSPNYRVVVTDLTGSITSAPVALTVTAATSTLSGSSYSFDGLTADLSAEGLIDWAQWGNGGLLGYEQKDPPAGQISNYSVIGVGTIFSYGGNGVHCVWTNGTPDLTGDTFQGLYVPGTGNGFELTAEATSSERVFNLYCAVYFSTMHVEAMMSDGSAPIFVDESFSGENATTRRYSFRYSSPTPGKQLIVRWWCIGNNITINAATLTYGPNNLKVQPVGGGQLQVTWPIGTLLEAPTVTGPWTTNNATSPYTFTPLGAQKYFRAIQ